MTRLFYGWCIRPCRTPAWNLLTARNAREGLDALRRHSPDVLLLDISLPDASGLELIGQVRDIDPKLPIAFITVSDDSHTAIEAMKRGAYDFLIKPLSLDNVRSVVNSCALGNAAADGSAGDNTRIGRDRQTKSIEHDVLIGRSPAMLEVYKEIGRIATQDVTVLICGESGTGKELVARAIYQHSSARANAFWPSTAPLLSDTLLESELFGHEKGAFTGADRQANRQVRAMPRRHDLSGRSGRHVARHAEQGSADPARPAIRTGRWK